MALRIKKLSYFDNLVKISTLKSPYFDNLVKISKNSKINNLILTSSYRRNLIKY